MPAASASESAPATHPRERHHEAVLLTINPLSLIEDLRDDPLIGAVLIARRARRIFVRRSHHPNDTSPASSQSTSASTNSSPTAASWRRRNSAIVE